MTIPKPARLVALHDDMLREKEQVAHEARVTDFAVFDDGRLEMTTRHGEHWHKVVRTDCGAPTIDMLRLMLESSVSLHARRMPKHQEFAALAKDVA